MIEKFYFKQFKFITSFVRTQFKCQTVLFDPLIGPYQVLPHWARVDLGAMAIKGYPYNPKSSRTWTPPSENLVSYPVRSLGRFYPSAEMQSLYSTVPADWALYLFK